MADDVALRMMEQFDLHDPVVAKDGVPQRVYSRLREQCPVQWSDAHGGFWVASRYQDVERVIKDPENFASSLGVVIPDPTDALTPVDREELFEAGKGLVGPPVAYDPPAHTPIRRALEPLFTPGTLVELHRRPDLRTELAATPLDDRLWTTAIEEFLRYPCPIQGFKRTARHEAQVGSTAVHPGERVLMLFASANFDEREFDRPHEVDIRRTANRHMTFGRGIHRCLGSHLARLEVRVMVQQVLQRIPDYTIDESKLEVHPDVGVAYGYESVPMRFTPGNAHG